MDQVETKLSEKILISWKRALSKMSYLYIEVRPKKELVEQHSRFQMEMNLSTKLSIGIKWLIRYSRARAGKGYIDKLASEIISASKGEGRSKEKEDTQNGGI